MKEIGKDIGTRGRVYNLWAVYNEESHRVYYVGKHTGLRPDSNTQMQSHRETYAEVESK